MSVAPSRVNQREYVGTVEKLVMSDRLAFALCEGVIYAHVIEHAEDPTEGEDFRLPEDGTPRRARHVRRVRRRFWSTAPTEGFCGTCTSRTARR